MLVGRAKSPVTLAPRTVLESASYAAGQIRQAIIAGELRPGDRLIETTLAEQLQMSRHPVREAIRELGREGLIEMRPNRGAVVAGVDAKDVLEVYEIRATLGSLALRHLLLGNRRLLPKDLARLEQLARKAVDHAVADDQPRMVQHDLAFQAEVVAASGLARATTYFRSLGDDIQRFINLLRINYPDKEATARREVMGLFEAIRDHDHARAEQIWHAKFEVAAQRLIALTTAEAPEPASARQTGTQT